MKIRGMGRIKRAAQRIRYRVMPGVLILLYHRVTELACDPYRQAVTPQHFSEHLEVLQNGVTVLPFAQAMEALYSGKLPHRAVTITFDDGYADNFYNANPLLERYDMPATVFVTAGQIGQKHEFWWDELERLLLSSDTLPHKLSLTVKGKTYQWDLDEAATYCEEDRRRDRSWCVWQQEVPPHPRLHFFREIYEFLHPFSIPDKKNLLDQLLVWTHSEAEGRITHRTLSVDELLRLAQGGLVEIGAHTVTHPVLSTLSIPSQQSEILQGKADLERILDRPVSSLAYPHGSPGDYTKATMEIAQEAGFDYACSTQFDLAWPNADRFQLPRIGVEDCNGEVFAHQLEEWLRG
jgi:peptidoglycan/xylan/chitin deacetylase (PgdA/CDA1 family)